VLRLSKLGPGREAYYLQAVGVEPPGHWIGHGSEQVGLGVRGGPRRAVGSARWAGPELGRGARFGASSGPGCRLRSHVRGSEGCYESLLGANSKQE
jgi:hypothetical protein